MQTLQSSATSWTASGLILTFWKAAAKVQAAVTLALTGVPKNCLGNKLFSDKYENKGAVN